MYTGGTPVAPVGVPKRPLHDQHYSEKRVAGLKYYWGDRDGDSTSIH